eukprot:gene41837-56652_t
MAENTHVDVKKLSFERAVEELESIVKRLEDGKVPLEESVAIYERGEALKRRCDELLRQAEARVDKITTDASGQITTDAVDRGTRCRILVGQAVAADPRRSPRRLGRDAEQRSGLAAGPGADVPQLAQVDAGDRQGGVGIPRRRRAGHRLHPQHAAGPDPLRLQSGRRTARPDAASKLAELEAKHAEVADAYLRAKAEAAHLADLEAIICIGESEAERKAGTTLDVLKTQLAGSLPDGATAQNTIVAYEPVWAIGTGLTPTIADVAEAHAFLRSALTARFGAEGSAMRILYGGSVKPSNAAELMAVANVDGALIGGASLKSADFLAICGACPNRQIRASGGFQIWTGSCKSAPTVSSCPDQPDGNGCMQTVLIVIHLMIVLALVGVVLIQ